MMNGQRTRSNPMLITQSPELEVSPKLSTLHSHHSNTRSTKALASKSRTKAPPKIGPKSRVPQKTRSIDPPETSSKSDEEDADPPTTLKDPKSRARIGAGPTVPQGESSVSQGARSDTQSRDGADDDATQRPLHLVIEIDSWSTHPSNPNSHVSVGQQGTPHQLSMSLSLQHRAESQSTQAHGFSPPPSSSRTSPSPPVLLPQSPPPPSFSSPHLTTQTTLDNTCNMDPDHVDDNEGMHLGGRFSAEQVAWAQNQCIEFLVDLDAKAKEWKRSPESVRRIALVAAPSKFQQNGNAWNAFQSSYCQSNPNLDSSVSASEYTSNVVRLAYLKLIKSFGGEDSDTWAAEATRLIVEHDGVKAAAAKQIAQSGGDITRIMSAQKEKWTHDMQWLAPWMCMRYLLWLATQTAVKGMLAALFKPYVEFSVFPWTNLAKILIEHKLVLRNFLPNAQFPNFGSEYSDHYGTSHWKALYFALQDTNPERKVTLSSLDDWPEGDASDIPLIVDHNGDVILSLKGARDAASKKVAGGSSGGGANGVTKKIRELSSDLRKGTKRAKGKQKSTLLSSAYINSESDNAVESDPSGPSKVHLGNELQPQPKPRPRFSNSQASPSVSGVTSAPPPPLIDLPRTDWRGVDLSYFDPALFDNTFNAYPGSVNGTMDRNADMIPLHQTSTLQHSDYPGTAQPDDLFGFSMGHQQGHVEIGMHDFGGPSTMSDGLNYENGVACMKFRNWGPIGAQLGLANMGYLAQLGPMAGGPP
ncbi:hypothetical protein BS47DRAFT_1363241 [Hydnum rufescens UP504]|uniref:Uncharacterized protein n=1 Tax=Hydnum rufescens UP504 TaxID=1448309 RepID=A0A9P6AUT0_9AGAM|nr:hypothetical protein BS47DRAFT_1363241 [Hydnum rufescens UP504]